MEKLLPLVDTFNPPFEIWSMRDMTQEEMIKFFHQNGYCHTTTKDKLKKSIDTAFKAAVHIAEVGADNSIDIFIDNVLSNNNNYMLMRKAMPSKIPKSLSDYQQRYPNKNSLKVNTDINQINTILSNGQKLFHGGKWFDYNQKILITTKPFSTTFSPLVAFNETIYKGKAYDANRVDLFVINVTNSKTPIFVYKNKGTKLGYEKEVLFSSGATMQLKSKTLVRRDCKVTKVFKELDIKEKYVPIYILEIDIS